MGGFGLAGQSKSWRGMAEEAIRVVLVEGGHAQKKPVMINYARVISDRK